VPPGMMKPAFGEAPHKGHLTTLEAEAPRVA